ncbi:hypothetical protein [Bacillus licheniformis]|jgi:hypothetical protein|uniref:hypothetical protein n=2 Tax=Bacillaceae TaxID=186817 RepID=UPI0008B7A52D|nr:hypothetical protein [Bacillus licheniformis]ARC65371.1 hypothetical protein B14_02373 [Bacillus licheniformis]AVI45575.1 hypothetical protein BL14DL4_00309 [Bacillus licheniformis]MCM3751008.1 hypothetical protein [Bacillus licheniformis]MCU9961872.1 hypothetical protein [Bacillus licheniformis]SEP70340.1 hypothetical protein SAMN04487883_101426 [Bacillus licheniformis]
MIEVNFIMFGGDGQYEFSIITSKIVLFGSIGSCYCDALVFLTLPANAKTSSVEDANKALEEAVKDVNKQLEKGVMTQLRILN